METTTQKLLDPDSKTKTFPFPNGSLKKHHILRNPNPNPNPPTYSLYRECLKNHAASLGGHAIDGCGEFMPVPSSNPSDPTSLKCAACGCHRNFHRRLPDPPPDELDRQDDEDLGTDRHMSDDDDSDDDVDDDHEGGMTDRTDRTSSPPPTYFPSAPQMLLALSTGAPGVQLHGMPGTGQPVPVPGPVRSMGPAISPGAVPVSGFSPGSVMGQPRKRFRTKFSPEQKQRMHELSEKLGWRLQKRDEGLVEEWCREIGVGKGVFKVWMHNNKHVFLGTGKRGESRERMERDGDGPGVALGMAGSGLRVGIGTGEGEAGTDGTGGISHVMNGSGGASSSS